MRIWLDPIVAPSHSVGLSVRRIDLALGPMTLCPVRSRERFCAEGHFIDLVMPTGGHERVVPTLRGMLDEEMPLRCPPKSDHCYLVRVESLRVLLVAPKIARLALTLRVMDRCAQEWSCS